jgi:flagellar hook-length control protein FliK
VDTVLSESNTAIPAVVAATTVSATSTSATAQVPAEHSASAASSLAALHLDAAADPQTASTTTASALQMARLVQQVSGSEVQMGIQTGEFGKIDIHTSLNQNQISARIYVEHGDLSRALADALPQLHEKLSVDHRVDAQIQLYNSGSGSSYGTDRQQQQQQQGNNQSSFAYQETDDVPPAVAVQEATRTASSTGLDMLA